MLSLALAGGGITFATEDTFTPYIESGQLVSLLDAFLPSFLVLSLFSPAPQYGPKLRALIEHIRQWRQLPATQPTQR